jgi:hypothetical protein
MTEREDFEAWFVKEYGRDPTDNDLLKHDPIQGMHKAVRSWGDFTAWIGWQARGVNNETNK